MDDTSPSIRPASETTARAMPILSIVVPVCDGEDALAGLLSELEPQMASAGEAVELIVANEGTRATSMNRGAARARGRFLWFLHADSRLRSDTVGRLLAAVTTRPAALHYFDLVFLGDGPAVMRLNQWGAWVRSRWLGVPFGDQGLCLARDTFARVGGYPEDAAFGEDHLFVWRCRQAGVRLAPVRAPLATSARTYRRHGWLKLTVLYQIRWIGQALPEWRRLRAGRS